MEKTFSRSVHIIFRRETLALVAVAALIIVSGISTSSGQSAHVSPEVYFADASQSGFSIIPASCPSDPHYSGQCSGSPPPSGACSLVASPWSIERGQSTTLFWQVADRYTDAASFFGSRKVSAVSATLSPDVGIVSIPNGSMSVSPSQTRTYVLTVTYEDGLTTFCDGTVSVQAQQAGQCTAFFSPRVIPLADSTVFEWSGQNAGSVSYPGGQSAVPASGNMSVAGGQSGQQIYTFTDGTNGAQCSDSLFVCPAGQTVVNGQCSGAACMIGYYCEDGNLYYRTPLCTTALAEECAYGCNSTACNPAPTPSGSISVVPSLVHRGETAQVTWSATNVRSGSCTVTENNPLIEDSWIGSSGARQTSPINTRTTYTLRCTGLDGSQFVETDRVDIIPVVQEK